MKTPNRSPEMPKAIRRPERSSACRAAAGRLPTASQTPEMMMRSTAGMVKIGIAADDAAQGMGLQLRIARGVGLGLPEQAGDDVAEEHHDAENMDGLQEQVHGVPQRLIPTLGGVSCRAGAARQRSRSDRSPQPDRPAIAGQHQRIAVGIARRGPVRSAGCSARLLMVHARLRAGHAGGGDRPGTISVSSDCE